MSKKQLPDKSSHRQIDAFLQQLEQMPRVKTAARRGRLLFAMDATASREPSWDTACQLQSQMFIATDGLGGLEIQLAYYRGFDEFHTSPWARQATDLLQEMTAVFCRGGHTQIEKILRHAIQLSQQQQLNAVVFVGDAMEEDAGVLRRLSGQLGLLGVPLFLFQEGNDTATRRTFQELAQLSHGAYCPFSSGSAAQLRDLLSAVAVYAAGGCQALIDYNQQQGFAQGHLSHDILKQLTGPAAQNSSE